MTKRSTAKERLERAFQFRPIENLTLDRWADKYRFIAPSTASVPGPWRTSRVEIARGIMRAATEPGVQTITLKTCTQLCKTEFVLNLLGFLIHQQPCPILGAFPKVDMVKSFSKERFASMARASPALRAILGDVMRDKSLESLAYKEFPGGFIALESAGSPTNLAARPIRVTLADEIDKFEDLKWEGDPLLLLEERTATFPNALHVRCCSPTVEETSRIEKSYRDSDMRRPFVACPHCAHEQTLDFFKHVHWGKSEDGSEHFPLTAAIYCEACGAEWSEDQRRKIITTEGAIRWKQTRAFTCCDVQQEPIQTRKWDWDEAAQCGYATCAHCNKRAVPNAHAGFTASKLYSPHVTIATLAENWIKVKDDTAQRQVFYNTALGQAYSAQAAKRVETHDLASRREAFGAAMPKEVVRLTCGVDRQSNRLECHVVGWGLFDECWSVHYEIIEGDQSKPEIWERLDRFLLSSFPHELGPHMRIQATCIDSGGVHTDMAYRFCQPRAERCVWAVKGSSWSKVGEPTWPVPKVRRTKDWGFHPVVINVDSAKDHLRQILLNDQPGPGYLHIPSGRSDAWLDQLTAERAVFENKAGGVTRKWILPRGRANEVWDTWVYAYTALCGLRATRKLVMERAAADLARQAKQLVEMKHESV